MLTWLHDNHCIYIIPWMPLFCHVCFVFYVCEIALYDARRNSHKSDIKVNLTWSNLKNTQFFDVKEAIVDQLMKVAAAHNVAAFRNHVDANMLFNTLTQFL